MNFLFLSGPSEEVSLVFSDSHCVDWVLVLVQSSDEGACGFKLFPSSATSGSENTAVLRSQFN
jgi:hypothetical protein